MVFDAVPMIKSVAMTYLIHFSIALACFFALSQCLGRFHATRFLLCIFFASIAFLQFYFLLFSQQSLENMPIVFMGYVIAIVVCVVSLYLYLTLTLENRTIEKTDSVHLLPIGLSLVSGFFFFQLAMGEKIALIRALYAGHYLLFFLPFTGFSVVLTLFYMWRIIRLDPRFASFNLKQKKGITGIFFLFMGLLAVVMGLTTLSAPLSVRSVAWVQSAFTLFFLLAAAIHVRHPAYWLTWVRDAKRDYLNN